MDRYKISVFNEVQKSAICDEPASVMANVILLEIHQVSLVNC